jgi:hypothetical protein
MASIVSCEPRRVVGGRVAEVRLDETTTSLRGLGRGGLAAGLARWRSVGQLRSRVG